MSLIKMSTNELQTIVDVFVESKGAAPAQKTAEWYSIRATTIGGSEVATVLNVNPFKTRRSLIADKAGISDTIFTGNIATRWGNLFEPLTREWAVRVLLMDDTIKETGSVEGVIDRQRYSPDGLGVVQLVDDNDLLNDYIVLFEFKAPYRSLPDGKISKHYIPQVQTGLLSIPICELAIFINNCYRKCSLAQIGFSDVYDTNFHSGDAKKRRTKKQRFEGVLGCGIIGFYQTAKNYEEAIKILGYGSESESECPMAEEYLETSTNADIEYDINILMNSQETPLDFGTAKEKTIDRLFELCEEKRVVPVYYPIVLNYEVINELEFVKTHKKEVYDMVTNPKKIIKMHVEQFKDFCDQHEHVLIGYLPWKLFKSDMIIETRDVNWKTQIEPKIVETLQIIDEIKNSTSPKRKYNEYYPAVADDIDDHVLDSDMFKSS